MMMIMMMMMMMMMMTMMISSEMTLFGLAAAETRDNRKFTHHLHSHESH